MTLIFVGHEISDIYEPIGQHVNTTIFLKY